LHYQGDREGFARPLTAQEAVLAELRREIVEGELLPGSRLRQDAIAERLGVSRVPVREALKILEAENLVLYVPRRGFTVAALDFDELAEIYNIRRLLEEEAVRLALPKLRAEDIEGMRRAVCDIQDASAKEDFIALTAKNREFHFLLFEGSVASYLIRIIRNLWDASDSYRSLYFAKVENRRAVNREHCEILKAIVSADVDRVIMLLNVHRDNALRELGRILQR